MGRPVNKRYFGLLDDGTNIAISCQVASNAESETGYIIKQKSSNKFLVNDLKTGTNKTVAAAVLDSGVQGNVGICKLVNVADGSLSANEMSISAYVVGGTSMIRIKKLYNRTCRDFNNVRYKWAITNDSTASIMTVTAI